MITWIEKMVPRAYLNQSSSLLYSYLIVLPLFLLYEGLIAISQPAEAQVRIAVDIWLKSLISMAGFDIISVTFGLVLAIGFVVLFLERKKLGSIKLSTFGWMHIESIAYAIIMAISVSYVVASLFSLQTGGSGLSPIDRFALSLGAGLYEELFFRVILVGLLFALFRRFFKHAWVAAALAAIIGALIFSWVHYIGDLGDTFTMQSFIFRALAGLVLNALYVWRGFGIAVCTHAWYDVFVLFL